MNSDAATLREAMRLERIRRENDRFPWESGWQTRFPELAPLLKAGVPRILLFRLFGQRWSKIAPYWERVQSGRNKPGSDSALLHQERSLVIHALSCGWDDGCQDWRECWQSQALLQTFWWWNNDPRDIADDSTFSVCLRIPISEALVYTAPIRHEHAARRRQREIERVQADPVWRIQTFLATQDRACSPAEIAEGTGMTNLNVRVTISRDKDGCIAKVARGQYALGKQPEPLPEPLGAYVSPEDAQWQRDREEMARWRAARAAQEAAEWEEQRQELLESSCEASASLASAAGSVRPAPAHHYGPWI